MIIDFDHPGSKIDSYCQIMLSAEPFVCKLHEETTFSHAGVTYDDVFEQNRIGHE